MYRTSRKIVPEPALSTREKESRWDEKEERKEEREKKEEIVEWSRLEAFRRTKGATDDALDYDQNKGTRETSLLAFLPENETVFASRRLILVVWLDVELWRKSWGIFSFSLKFNSM